MYQTIKAMVRQGKIELLEEVNLPDETPVLVTVLAELPPPSVGEGIINGLEDALAGRTTSMTSEAELAAHLDTLFQITK